MQIQYGFRKNDEYNTPAYAVYPIIKRLRPDTTVWCPFDREESRFVKVLSENGFEVVYGHIQTGQDFFEVDVPKCDYIISNPPYSRKGDIINRLYEIGIPFAMLINFQGIFDNRERFKLFMDHRVEMLWLSPRVNYVGKNGGKSCGVPFQSGYLCSGICEKQIEFEILDKSLQRQGGCR